MNKLKGVKLLGSVASMLNFSRLVEMLYLCRCMQFCALPETQASSQMTGRGALYLWKGKGDHQDCNNYRGVTLLSVLGKVFAQLIIEGVRQHLCSPLFCPSHSRPSCLMPPLLCVSSHTSLDKVNKKKKCGQLTELIEAWLCEV